MIKFSLSKWACYDSRLNYKSLPDDLVDLTDAEYKKYWIEIQPDGLQLKRGVYPFEHEEIPNKTTEELQEIEKRWRDSQLLLTDQFGLIDYPDNNLRASMREYRQKLRDYPNVKDFGDDALRPVDPRNDEE